MAPWTHEDNMTLATYVEETMGEPENSVAVHLSNIVLKGRYCYYDVLAQVREWRDILK